MRVVEPARIETKVVAVCALILVTHGFRFDAIAETFDASFGCLENVAELNPKKYFLFFGWASPYTYCLSTPIRIRAR